MNFCLGREYVERFKGMDGKTQDIEFEGKVIYEGKFIYARFSLANAEVNICEDQSGYEYVDVVSNEILHIEKLHEYAI